MSTIRGYLNKIDERVTKFGSYYALVIDGKKYDTGSKFPPKGVQVGDYIAVELTTNDRGYETIVQGSLSKADAPAGVTPAAAAQAAAVGDTRQETISKQAALNSALSMAQLLVTGGAVPVGAKATPAQLADKLEAIVLSYTAKFYRMSTGQEYELPEGDVASAVAGEVDWQKAE